MTRIPSKPGPFADAGGKLTAEGQRQLAEWLVKYPRPIKLLAARHGKLVSVAQRLGMEADEINACCLHAAVMSMLRFDPSKGFRFSTFVMQGMRNVVGGELRRRTKHHAKGVVVHSGNERAYANGDSIEILDTLGVELPAALDAEDHRDGLRREIIRVVRFHESDPRNRAVYYYRYGLLDGKPRTMEEAGVPFGITRARVGQILKRINRRIAGESQLKERGSL